MGEKAWFVALSSDAVHIIGYNLMMRTTLSIDDDVLDAARCYAEANRVPLGEAISTMARRGISRIRTGIGDDGFPIIEVPDDFPLLTDADVARLLADFP